MTITEQIIAAIAPHRCITCAFNGSLLCEACIASALVFVPDRCYRCHAASSRSQVCKSCRASVRISHVWIAAAYRDIAKTLVHKLKFERAKDAAVTMASILDDVVPRLPDDTIVSHIPTANNRIRARGYDQAALIAKRLARLKGLNYEPLLVRKGYTRQVGAGRNERFKHLEQALSVRPRTDVTGRHVLLVDDVTTTGATIEAAAKILKNSGAKTINVAVFAQA